MMLPVAPTPCREMMVPPTMYNGMKFAKDTMQVSNHRTGAQKKKCIPKDQRTRRSNRHIFALRIGRCSMRVKVVKDAIGREVAADTCGALLKHGAHHQRFSN